MTNTKELRTGNYLLHETHGLINVGHIQNNFYAVCVNGDAPAVFDPIPLTEESLNKLGIFEEQYGTGWGEIDQRIRAYKLSEWLYLQKNLLRDGSGRYDGFALVSKAGLVFRTVLGCLPIKTVHRLQNIVFDLSGQELTIKNTI